MTRRYFDLQGASLAVSADEPALLDRFARIFGGAWEAEGRSPVCFELELAIGTPATVPADADILYQGPVLDEGECIAALAGNVLLQVFPGKASLELSNPDRRARLVVAPHELQRVSMNLGMHAVEAALRASGQIPVHAAGLTLPDGRMVMIIGQSGAGKTTSALALCAAGFGLCSDDLIICRVVGDEVVGWGLPRSLKVHRRTAGMLPWVEPLLTGEWSAEDEKPLPLAALRSVMRVEDREPKPIAALYRLERSAGAQSRVAPIGQTEILAVAAADHVRTSYRGVLPDHGRHLASLAGLIRRLPDWPDSGGR